MHNIHTTVTNWDVFEVHVVTGITVLSEPLPVMSVLKADWSILWTIKPCQEVSGDFSVTDTGPSVVTWGAHLHKPSWNQCPDQFFPSIWLNHMGRRSSMYRDIKSKNPFAVHSKCSDMFSMVLYKKHKTVKFKDRLQKKTFWIPVAVPRWIHLFLVGQFAFNFSVTCQLWLCEIHFWSGHVYFTAPTILICFSNVVWRGTEPQSARCSPV